MNISSILRRKGTHVETATPETTVCEAAQRLVENRIGSPVVLDHAGQLVGIVSEHDLVRSLSECGRSAWNAPIETTLTPRPVTCKPDASVRDVMLVMTRQRARHIPVFADEVLIGVVSIGDVVKGQFEDLELEMDVLRDYVRAREYLWNARRDTALGGSYDFWSVVGEAARRWSILPSTSKQQFAGNFVSG